MSCTRCAGILNARNGIAGGLLLLLAFLAAAALVPVKHEALLVHAGAGLRPALDEIGSAFAAEGGTMVEYSYKGSGCLLADITMSQRGDLYIPGEEFYMEQARQRGFVDEDAVVAAMGIVMVVKPGNPMGLATLQDLARPGLRVGLGDPDAVACGRAAREALEKAGLLDAVQRNVVMSALNVIELGNAVKLGHLDAAVVWDATAVLYPPTAVTTIQLPESQRVDSPIPVAVLRSARKPAEARRLLAFTCGETAVQIFRRHGYSVRDAAGEACANRGTSGEDSPCR